MRPISYKLIQEPSYYIFCISKFYKIWIIFAVKHDKFYASCKQYRPTDVLWKTYKSPVDEVKINVIIGIYDCLSLKTAKKLLRINVKL